MKYILKIPEKQKLGHLKALVWWHPWTEAKKEVNTDDG